MGELMVQCGREYNSEGVGMVKTKGLMQLLGTLFQKVFRVVKKEALKDVEIDKSLKNQWDELVRESKDIKSLIEEKQTERDEME